MKGSPEAVAYLEEVFDRHEQRGWFDETALSDGSPVPPNFRGCVARQMAEVLDDSRGGDWPLSGAQRYDPVNLYLFCDRCWISQAKKACVRWMRPLGYTDWEFVEETHAWRSAGNEAYKQLRAEMLDSPDGLGQTNDLPA